MGRKKTLENKDEETSLIEYFDKIQDFAQKEINRTSENYKTLIKYLTIIFVVTIGAASYFLGKSKSQIEDQILRGANLALSEAKVALRDSVKSYMYNTNLLINDAVSNKFSDPIITKLVGDEAKKRIREIADPIIIKEVDAYYKKIIIQELKIYSDLNNYYLRCINSHEVKSFKHLVSYRDSTENETLYEISDYFIQDIINKYYHKEDSLAITKRFGDLIFVKGNHIFDNLSATVLRSDSIAENLVYFFGIVRSYNSRHGTNFKPDEFNKILNKLGALSYP